jgi:hypothetical protein
MVTEHPAGLPSTSGSSSAFEVDAEDFQARLSSRTKVPAERLSQFTAWPNDRIRRETDVVARVLKRFAEAVVSSMENPASADEFLRGLDLKTISRDHDWRAIFSTLRAQDVGNEDYKRTVLIKYLQYLSFRKRLLEFIHVRKQGLEETDAFSDLDRAASASPYLDRPEALDDFARLPVGETIQVVLRDTGTSIEVMLAAHLFRVVGGKPPSFIDQNGVTYFLQPGRNMVGRHPESDVVADQNFNDVSRAHLVIDWDPEGWVRITDLSTRGTSVRRRVLDRAARFVTD